MVFGDSYSDRDYGMRMVPSVLALVLACTCQVSIVRGRQRVISITLRDQHGAYTIEASDVDEMNIDDAIERLIKPVLLAAGFHKDTIVRELDGFATEITGQPGDG